MSALDYFLKVNLYGLLFVGCYWLLLRRHTFFTLNRFYLLLSVGLSLVLPLVSLPAQTVETLPVPVGVLVLPVDSITVAPAEAETDWAQIGWMAYGLISSILLVQVAVQCMRLVRLIRRSPRQRADDCVLVQPNNPNIPTFSFFSYLILNPADAGNELIIEHERVHIRQQHSVDVLALSLLKAVFWACPILWFIERMLRQVHEFLADKPANQPSDYARFLVEYTFGIQPDPLTNGFFNPSLLKQRIQMLHQRATTRWALGKYALVLPLAFGLLAMTTAREEIATIVSQATSKPTAALGRLSTSKNEKPLLEIITNQDDKVYTVVQQQPKFPGGTRALRKFFSDNLRYPQEAQQKKIEGRVFVRFIVSKTGVVRDVSLLKGLGYGCDEEALRVAHRMPNWIPGRDKGQAVAVVFNLPIQFSLGKQEDKRTGQVEPATYKPTGTSIGDFPTIREADYPNQPRLSTVKVPATLFRSDTNPQYNSVLKIDTAITIRGTGPLGELGGEPLYIIDGVEQPKGGLGKLNPNTIESMTVLKNSAAATYGPKATYGVVLITTKKK